MTPSDQRVTLRAWLDRKRMSQRDFIQWLSTRGILISVGYLNEMLTGREMAGPKFIEIFKEITGVSLVPGLVEDK